MSSESAPGPEIPADTFELRLAIARFYAGHLSAREAAVRVGVSGQAWRNWEAGMSAGARKPAMVAHIARQLGVDEDWLREGGPLPGPGAAKAPHPDGPDGGLPSSGVRHQGLEPRTRCFGASPARALALVA